MKTIKLDKKAPSVDELLAMARRESVLLVSEDGASFVLEEADDFDREVAQLGSSEKFMRFLEKRSKEKGAISIEQFAKERSQRIRPTRSKKGQKYGRTEGVSRQRG